VSGLAGILGAYASGTRPEVSESWLPAFDGVIFDMDGLLIDTELSYAHAWKHAALAFGVELDRDFLHSLFGRHATDVEQCLAGAIGDTFDRQRFFAQAERLWHEHVARHGIPLMPGAEFILEALEQAAVPFAVATNSDSPYARICLDRAGLAGRFPILVCRDEVAAGKPEPDLFIEAAQRLGFPVERCLVLEDSPTGLLGASRAGAITVLISSRNAPADAINLARATFTSLEEAAVPILAAARTKKVWSQVASGD
jgi:HAD superfamily hydrolase (TIGR01509 family)